MFKSTETPAPRLVASHQKPAEIHPVATTFPEMGPDELGSLADDIRENGLRAASGVEIKRFLEKEIAAEDGRSRPRSVDIIVNTRPSKPRDARKEAAKSAGKGRPQVSAINSQHLTKPRHARNEAAIAVEIKRLLEKEIAEEQAAKCSDNGKQGGRGNKKGSDTNCLPLSKPRNARKEAAVAAGVSHAYINDAENIAKASPTVAVFDGKCSSTTIMIPAGFHPSDYGIHKHGEEARVIIDRIIHGSTKSRDSDGWASLRYDDAVSLVGNNKKWEKLKDGMIASRAIECNNRYEPKKFAMRYRMDSQLRGVPLVPYTIRDPKLAAMVSQARSIDCHRDLWEPVHFALEACLGQVRVNEQSAIRLTCQTKSQKQEYARNLVSIVNAGQHRMSVGIHSRRVYTTITRMSKKLRHCLTFDGQPMVELDITSSQPLILGAISRRKQGGEGSNSSPRAAGATNTSVDSAPITVHSYTASDLVEYIEACEDGSFYRVLADAIEMPCGTDAERAKVKRWWCSTTFGRHKPSRPRWQLYAKRFPTVAAKTETLKVGGHCKVSRELQGTESSIMIHGVAQKILFSCENACILTVHDSIICPGAMVNHVQKIIVEIWSKYGVTPRIKSA